ncbi:MAG: HAMP domain-containing histidine kinase [Clostridia bacterium]|nr:HAMP domain-containing histidine kinase [Clostridia bacterium]
MNFSIKRKLFLSISGLILLFVLLSWLLNSFFLDKYYIYTKKNTLMDCYNQINNTYSGDPEAIYLDLEKFESNKGLRIIILDKEFKIKYFFNERFIDSKLRRNGPRVPNLNMEVRDMLKNSKISQVLQGKILIEIGKDSRLNTNFITLFSKLNNGDFLVLNTSVTAMQESADIANKFFLLTGIITIFSGCIIIYFLTGRFTGPILELNNITKGMAELDFSKRYNVNSTDEIGQLGSSINSLSEQLEKSILELKQANKKLMEDIEKERKIDEMRKEFISNVSHELKTPIALIQGYAEGLKVNVNEDEENKNFYCETIMNETQKMNKLVKELLELSKLESGIAGLEKVDFEVLELVNSVLKKSSIVLKEKDVEVKIDCEENTGVNADYDKTEQVLTNYLCNALDHINEKKEIRIAIRKVNGKVRISVFNSGSHIDKDEIEKIWISFYKVDKARTRSFGGTGLGLSIVKAIQEASQNQYGVENVGGGVEFWFEMDQAKMM